ncbi:MAG: allantoicase, partial [Planctomycetota bacterium]
VLLANDEFFAPKENLLKPGRSIFIPEKYTDQGKWMDGWESRRKRVPGHDWCIIQLGTPGVLHGVDIDTNYFLGNHPPYASIEACCFDHSESLFKFDPDQARWTEILKRSPLRPGSQNIFGISNTQRWTHLRLNIYPDGGVARFRAYGEVVPDWSKIKDQELIDLALITNGSKALACSDMFFSPMENLLLPGSAVNMGDGWETRRRRGPGYDWVVIQLGISGTLQKIEIDTHFFKGNYPDRCRLEGCNHTAFPIDALNAHEVHWLEILPETKLEAHKQHFFSKELLDIGPITHIRLNIYPDGGVSRLRLWGFRTTTVDPVLEKINQAEDATLSEMLLRCCGSKHWVEKMKQHRPFTTLAHLFQTAQQIWFNLPPSEWMNAFSQHPKIGDKTNLKEKFKNTQTWAENEQSQIKEATDEVLQKLVDGNKVYESKFGHIFIVCATGKSANEMLHLLEKRIGNNPYQELKIAAEEQFKITRLRLKKL